MHTRQAVALVFCLAMVLPFASSCSSGPTIKMGRPEWYWTAAKEQFAAGDFVKTQEHLEKLMATDNPYRARAATWHLVVLAGMARGHKDLAEAYEAGGPISKTQGAEFRRTAADMYRHSRQYAMGLAEEMERFHKQMDGVDQYSLEFSFPLGSPTENITLGRVRKGILPQESERLAAQRQTAARGVLLQTAAVVGAAEDTAKAAEAFKNSPVQVPRAVFLFGLAESLLEQSRIFDRRKLNEPDKRKILLQMAADCMKPAMEAGDATWKKKAKDLQAKIDKEQKTLPKT